MQETPTCPNCSQIFGTKDPVRPHGPRMPLLLRCGHTFCEGCLTKLARTHKTSITCPTCQASTTLKIQDSTKSLWPDIYMLGLLAANRSLSLHQDDARLQTLGMVQAPRRRDSTQAKQPEKEMCGECTSRPATCKCVKCECSMCSLCFDKIHKASKVLRKHQAQPLADDSSSSYVVPSTCSKHDNRPIEYFCEDDHIAICSHCVIMGEHREHAITAMEQKNKRAMDDLEPAVQTAALVLKRLAKSDKTLSKAAPQVRQGIMNVVDNIRAHFHTLHSHLQARELNLLEDVEKLYQFDGSPIEEMRSKLLDQMRELDCDVKYAQKLLTNNGHTTVNAQVLLDKLKHASKMPCYATLEKCDESSIRCSFDDDLVKNISHHGEVRGSSAIKFSLKPLSDVPEDVDEDSDTQSTTTVSENHDGSTCYTDGEFSEGALCCDHRAELCKMSTLTPNSCGDLGSFSEGDSLSQSSETSGRSGDFVGRRRSLQKMRLQQVHQELVYVTHIKHPCQFVIQRCADFRRLKAMSSAINKHCSNPATRKHIPTELSPGDLVLARYTLDENWYRGRVLSIVTDDENTPSQKAEVFYVDYGNTEMMPFNRLRIMQKNFLSTPELSVTCSLVDIVPVSQNGEWDVEATLTFARMTEDKPMLMTVLREEDTTFVDLSKPPSDEIEDDRPVSMRDALVFLELARFSSPSSVPASPGGTKPKRYLTPELSKVGSSFSAMVSHVNSIHGFYIQKIGDEARYLVEMMTNLQQIYGTDTGDLYTVFCPQKDMICAAQFSADNTWYRAEVTQLAGHRMVTVKYVDFGNEEQLSHWKLRKLRDSFLILPKQAIHCKLADVEPVNKEHGWSVEALTSLRDFTTKPVMVKVTGVTGDGQLQVVLHEAPSGDDEDTEWDTTPSLNTLLVRQGQAHSTGPGSVFTPVVGRSVKHKDKSPGKTLRPDKSGHGEVNRTAKPSPHVQGEVNGTAAKSGHVSGDLDIADATQVQVVPSHIDSPNKFFVQLTDMSGLNSLMSDLEDTYTDSEPDDSVQWKDQDFCAALYSGNKRWHRAQILSIKDDVIEVVMLDYGYRDSLKSSQLRPLEESFLTQSSFCLRCHLIDIQPAGDITKWSRTACEYLVELLARATCFIKQKGGVEDGSLAVDLLLEERITGDALSADRVEYNSVTKALLEKGLALPKRRAIVKKPPQPLPDSELPTSPDASTVASNFTSNSVASKIAMATTNGTTEEGVSSVKQEGQKMKEVIVTEEKLDTRVEFPPPDLPSGKDVTLVPTYVDYNCVVFGQEVKPAESAEGRFGFILMEHTLEVIAQDTYFARHRLRRTRIPRDGNCLFRALASSGALGGDPSHHTKLRAAVVMAMRANWVEYRNVLGDVDRDEYLSDMAKSAYGGEPEIHVLCQLYGVKIRVYLGGLNYRVQYRDYSIHSSQTDLVGAPALVEISYLADGAHYDLVVPDDEDVTYLEQLYDEWRMVRIAQLRDAPTLTDVSTYGKPIRMVVVIARHGGEDDSLLQQLMDRLQTHYADTPVDTGACWEVGQAVIARYMLDDKFYRAQITKINSDNASVEVHYVDFGNNETVPMERLRRDVILAEVPRQCLALQVVGIRPCNPGKWPVKVLDYIHHLVVGQTCKVRVQEAPSVGELIKVTMQLSDGRDLASHLFDLGLAAPDMGTMEPEEAVAPPTEIPRRTVRSPYQPLARPEIGDLTLICVTQVSSPTEVYIQYVKQVRAVDPQFVAINRDLDELLRIADELAVHAASYPRLKDICPGIACCVQYSVDSCWYRAEVVSVEMTYVGVLYVDYGNTEYVTRDRIKVLPDEFRSLAAQAIPCHLAGIVAPARSEALVDSVTQTLTELFAGKILISIAQSYGDERVYINLYEHSAFMKESHNAPLAYQDLIDSGQLISLRQDSDNSAIVEEEIEEELDEIETNVQRKNCDTAERKRPLSWSEQAELEMPLDDKPM